MNKGARIFTCYWNETLVAMFSFLNLPSGTNKYGYRVHRMVVLPDFQGLGIGTKLLEFFGEWFLSHGEKMYLRSSHIRLANHCRKSNKWIEGGRSEKAIKINSQVGKYKNQNTTRTPFSFEYVGEQFTSKEHQPIVCIGEIEEPIAEQLLEKISDEHKFPIVVSGIADIKEITVWEKIAKAKGIRTEVLFIKQHDVFTMSQRNLQQEISAIIIGAEAQQEIAKYKTAKEIKNLITYNYKYNPPKYYEKLSKRDEQ